MSLLNDEILNPFENQEEWERELEETFGEGEKKGEGEDLEEISEEGEEWEEEE